MKALLNTLRSEREVHARAIQHIDTAIDALSSIGSNKMSGVVVRRKPKFSAAARGRIAAAQRARWAKIKAAQKK